jgi:putative type IIS restriction/modification enzyme
MKLEKKPIKRKDKKNFSIREDFFKQKIVWKAVGRNLAFSILEEGKFITAPASFITSENSLYYILGFLCSSFAKYFIYNNSDTTGAGDIMLNIQSLVKIPIPQPSINNQEEIENIISEIIEGRKENIDTILLENKLDEFINNILRLSPEEIDFIRSF